MSTNIEPSNLTPELKEKLFGRKIQLEEIKKIEEEHNCRVRRGRFTLDEEKTIRRYIKLYCDSIGITENDLDEDFGATKISEQVTQIAYELERPQMLVAQKINLMYKKSGTKFTETEIEQLLKLVEEHGNDWAKIGSIMSKYRQECRNTYCWVMSKYGTKGPWTEEEDEQLRVAANESLVDGKPNCWEKIAAKVGTRNSVQCNHRWHTLEKQTTVFTLSKAKEFLRHVEPYCTNRIIPWRKISIQMNNEFHPNTLRNRYRAMIRNYPDHMTVREKYDRAVNELNKL